MRPCPERREQEKIKKEGKLSSISTRPGIGITLLPGIANILYVPCSNASFCSVASFTYARICPANAIISRYNTRRPGAIAQLGRISV